MRSAKICLVIAAAAIAFLACSNSSTGNRYSIADSKTYEASIFRQNCSICHGPEGEGRTLEDDRIIPNIRDGEHKYKTDDQIYDHIANGGNGMVPFRDMLTEREIRMMVRFVQKDLRQGP